MYAYAIPYVWIVRPEQQPTGVDVVIARSTRRISSDAVDPTIKNFHWGDLVRGQFEAYDRDGSLAILTDRDGFVTEGAGFNVFALVDGRLCTPGRGVLEGITRRTAMEIASAHGVPVEVCDVPAEHLGRAQEIFLTSTAGGIMPVAKLGWVPRRRRRTRSGDGDDPRGLLGDAR
jgi:branched-chain amino acid aminotransferase